MSIRIVRLGTKRQRGEGLRIGTVRRPPRGIRKADYAKEDWYDVWLPDLAPSEGLLRSVKNDAAKGAWRRFERRFRAELKRPDRAHLLDLLAAMSHHADFSVGCYCADESHCHRSILREALEARGASMIQ